MTSRLTAQLLQQDQVIDDVPTLYHLAVGETKDADCRKLHGLVGGGNPHELSSVCTTTYNAHCYLISFSNQILNNIMIIGEGGAHHVDQLLDALSVRRCSGGRTIVDKVGSEHLIDYSQVPLVDQLLNEAMHLSFVFFY